MKKTLKELIEMAERGDKFEAKTESSGWYDHVGFADKHLFYSVEQIRAEWTVRMKRESRVIYVPEKDGELFDTNEQNK